MSDKTKAQERIDELKAELGRLVGDWRTNSHSPPNHIRQTGDGKIKALVDRWCGGYQNAHYPTMIGWKVERSNGDSINTWKGVVLVNNSMPSEDSERPDKRRMIEAAIKKAKEEADLAIESAMQEVVPGFTLNPPLQQDPLLQQVKELLKLSGVNHDVQFDVFSAEENTIGLFRPAEENTIGVHICPTTPKLRKEHAGLAPMSIWKNDKGYSLNLEDEEMFTHTDLKEVVAKAVSITLEDFVTTNILYP